MPGLDVFKADGFSVIELTDAINKIPHIPGRLGELGLFESQGITTTSIMIEERDGTLALIPTQPRGAPATQNVSDKRKIRSIAVPHIPFEDRLTADEVQNIRAFGSDSETETIQAMVNQKLQEMSRKHDATLEWHRIGSIKGQILDADATTVILDLFTAFNVTQIAEKDFDLDNGSPAPGAVRKKINEVIRAMEDELGATPMQGILAICGSTFFDDLVAHSEVKDAYERWIANGQPGEFLRMRTARRSFFYAGITFEEYRGKVGATDFVDTNKAHFFPVGVPGLFKTYYAPADFIETVNTLGLPRYAKQATDERFQRWVDIHTQQNPLNLCTRPKVLIQGKRT